MKIRLAPLYFDPGRDDDFDTQLEILRGLFVDQVDFLAPLPLGTGLPVENGLPAVEAVIFPQFLGEAYRQVEQFRAIEVPILIVTSEFGTLSMWDWEIISYLRSQGIETIAPYNLEQTRLVFTALGLKRELRQSRFLVYQDNPGAGFQASIFKRFYWWEDECTAQIKAKFGVSVEKRSFRELGARAQSISDARAGQAWEARRIRTEGLPNVAILNAMKLFLALQDDLEQELGILAVGINCLNESHFSSTTPCLAWNLLFEETGLLWGCEADTLSMLTKVLLYRSLGAPVMMTNLYPFLMGQAALKHEHIPEFPDLAEPENHVLLAHCGYLGVLPESFAAEWTLRPKVLAIVDEAAHALDARLPTGAMTLVKLSPTLETLSVVPSFLEGYVQYPGSHCLNGGVLRVQDGRRLMASLDSHHYILMTGDRLADLELVAPVLGLKIKVI